MKFISYQHWMHDTLKSKDPIQAYIIELRKNRTNWFFHTLSTATPDVIRQVIWTPVIKQAHIFLTEEMVEEFKADYISPRKVSIVRMANYTELLSY